MDIRQLKYFVTVAREGQITRAAKALHMEQPPLSRQLKLMEQELNATLFDRGGHRLRLTQAGEVLLNKAEHLLRQFDEAIEEVKELDEGIRGMLPIGAVVSCISLLPANIAAFRSRYPAVTFKISEGDHYVLGGQLIERNIELIVTRLPFEAPFDSQPYDVLPLPSDPFVAVIPAGWGASLRGDAVDMKQLAGFPFLTLKTDQTTGMHEKVVSECRLHGFEPRIVGECSSVAVIISLVKAGIGITLLPKSVMDSFALPDVRVLALADAAFESDVGIVWLKDRYLSRRARRFIELFAGLADAMHY